MFSMMPSTGTSTGGGGAGAFSSGGSPSGGTGGEGAVGTGGVEECQPGPGELCWSLFAEPGASVVWVDPAPTPDLLDSDGASAIMTAAYGNVEVVERLLAELPELPVARRRAAELRQLLDSWR